MKKYIRAYIASVEKALADDGTDLRKLREELLIQTGFIQHERLIHLIVTVFVGLVLFIGLVVFFVSEMTAFLAVCALLLVLTFAYLAYYYFIENSTQQLYRLYNRISVKIFEQDNDEKTASVYNNKDMT
ncbi:MAG: hypothetical protein ACI4JJ_02750 [Huintestinicola sp.]